MKNTILPIIITAVIVGAGGFFAGMKYQESQRPAFVRQFGGANGGPRGSGQNTSRFGQGFRPVSGEIISSDDKSITVKLEDGSSKIVLVGESAMINKSSGGTKEDLKTGEKVSVFGTENTDGSVTAQNIQLGGAMFQRVQMTSPQP